jgi:acyl-coenzyme A synthetase/AMP-(fatty) acid ligase
VLTELQSLTGFNLAITDDDTSLPSQIEAFVPSVHGCPWPPENGLRPVEMDTPIIHLFTGGSTGTPKSWPKSVRNLMAEGMRIMEEYSYSTDDCVVSTVSPLHIYGLLYSVLAPLAASASVTQQTPMFPSEIEKEIQDHNASVFISVPAHYRALREHNGPAMTLRIAFSSAGMLSPEDAQAFSEKHDVGIIEVYGSTETGGVGSRERYAGESDFGAFSTVEIKCVEGDLWVKSDYMSPGLPLDNQGFYQIGDRAIFSPQHRFSLVGRSDTVIKVGGKRVDLEAVRETLVSHDQVREALVTALPVGRAREHMIVAVVEGRPDSADLAQFLADSLEPYARPRRIKMVDQMPTTDAGKWDRQTIEALFSD